MHEGELIRATTADPNPGFVEKIQVKIHRSRSIVHVDRASPRFNQIKMRENHAVDQATVRVRRWEIGVYRA